MAAVRHQFLLGHHYLWHPDMPRYIKPIGSMFVLFLLLGIEPASPVVTLAFVGDIMLGRGIAMAHHDGNWANALAYITPYLSSADLALANLESPITMFSVPVKPLKYDLRASPESISGLTNTSLDFLSLANNHAMDYGILGLQETQKTLMNAGLNYIGPDSNPKWSTIRGLRLAFFSFEDVNQPLKMEEVTQAVVLARQSGAVVIVSMHWGNEYQPGPTKRQRALAQALADAGVSLIWGHHSHVMQPMAWITSKSARNLHNLNTITSTLVFYGLGNALFDQYTPPDTRRSAVLLVTLAADGVKSIKVIPFQIDPRRGCIVPADAETAEVVIHRLEPIDNFYH
jgi:poly-gamma-glutamate synthesis protein (capsule biosynthesis protein)